MYVTIFHKVPLNSDFSHFIIKYDLIIKISMAYLFIWLLINLVFNGNILQVRVCKVLEYKDGSDTELPSGRSQFGGEGKQRIYHSNNTGQSLLEEHIKCSGDIRKHGAFQKQKVKTVLRILTLMNTKSFKFPTLHFHNCKGEIGRISSNFIIFNRSSHLKHD